MEKELVQDIIAKMQSGEFEVRENENVSMDLAKTFITCRPNGYEHVQVTAFNFNKITITIIPTECLNGLYSEAYKKFNPIDKEIEELEKQLAELKAKKAGEAE